MGQLRRKFPGVPMMALTATATPAVQEDILKVLRMTGPDCKRFIVSETHESPPSQLLAFRVLYRGMSRGAAVELSLVAGSIGGREAASWHARSSANTIQDVIPKCS